MHLRKDDMVEVIAGDDKGTRGKVLRVLRAQNKVVVEGIQKAREGAQVTVKDWMPPPEALVSKSDPPTEP